MLYRRVELVQQGFVLVAGGVEQDEAGPLLDVFQDGRSRRGGQVAQYRPGNDIAVVWFFEQTAQSFCSRFTTVDTCSSLVGERVGFSFPGHCQDGIT